MRPAFALAERGVLGDALIRLGIRRLVSRRLREQQVGGVEAQRERRRSLVLEDRWRVGGLHYHRTLEAWLGNLDRARAAVLPILGRNHDQRSAALWLQRWRPFLMACSELFAYGHGDEWYVAHYRLAPR